MGEVVPDVALRTRTNSTASISNFRGVTTAVVVVCAHCPPCHDLLRHIATRGATPDPLDLHIAHTVIVSVGSVDDAVALNGQLGLQPNVPVLFDPDSHMFADWGVSATPTLVIVDEQLRFVSHTFGFTAPPSQPAMLEAGT